MSTKTVLQILEKSIELANLLVKLKKEEKQFKGVPPIPDYKKGAKESIVLPNGEQITLSYRSKKVFEAANLKTDYSKEWSKKLNDFLKKNNVSQEIILGTSNKIPTPEEIYNLCYNAQPFAHTIENKEPKQDGLPLQMLETTCLCCNHRSLYLHFNLKKSNITKCKTCFTTFKIVISDGCIKLLKV